MTTTQAVLQLELEIAKAIIGRLTFDLVIAQAHRDELKDEMLLLVRENTDLHLEASRLERDLADNKAAMTRCAGRIQVAMCTSFL